MSIISDRIKAAITRVGETLSFTKLNGTAGTFSVVAIVQPCDTGTLRTYLDDVEVLGAMRPAIKFNVASDVNVIADDTFTRGPASMTVWKVFPYYVGADVVCKEVIASVVSSS